MVMIHSYRQKWVIGVSQHRVYRILRTARLLHKDDALEPEKFIEALSYEGFSAHEIATAVNLIFGPLGLLQQYPTGDLFYEHSTRIFGTGEKKVLSLEAQQFLLQALQARLINTLELEQVLVLALSRENVDVQDVQALMAEVVSDEALSQLLAFSHDQYVH